MPIPQEIYVFFPCHTLEDFPTHLRDDSAEGILAAWTAPWHPAIIAATGIIPTWHRADTPPVELKQRLLIIPSASENRLPSDLKGRMADAIDCHQLSVTTRDQATKEILQYLGDDVIPASDHNDLFNLAGQKSSYISSADFFAIGYLALQVQVMTRRLRYSSNLDQVTFSEHVVAAAKAFVANHDSAQASLQAAFDLLAEERDHYFSSDPHLIDLILVTSTTLGQPLMDSLQGDHPLNLLMSAETAQQIAQKHPEIAQRIRERLADESLSIAGGSPDDSTRLDFLGSSAVAQWLDDALNLTEKAFGVRPTVFGRLGGGIPGDLPPWLLSAGFRGAITNDFFSAVGWQDEPKMLWQSGGAELEALTAKPLDVLQPQTFLGLGPKLGELADAGQVSAALLVRWPGTDSSYMQDLRIAAKRTLALGQFWTLDKFFTHGERPYHSCTLPAVIADGFGLETSVQADTVDPLCSVARKFLHDVQQESTAICRSLANLINPASAQDMQLSAAGSSANSTNTPCNQLDNDKALATAARDLSSALGFQPANDGAPAKASVLVNPHCGATRCQITLDGEAPASNTPGLFGASKSKGLTSVTIDIPGHGFATVQSASSSTPKAKSKRRLFGFFSKSKALAQNNSLSNEFLDVAIHPDTGAVAAVHAGQQRGNRFSWQLAYYDAAGPDGGYSKMHANSIKVVDADSAKGTIETCGELRVGERVVGQFTNRYTVQRGSRWLEIESQLRSLEAEFSAEAWKNYVAGRATWATEAISVRPLVRDKRHRTSGKRIEAPLGVSIDEGDRKLLVCGYGLPAHRRIGAKELDTLLIVRGETSRQFRLAYGFDVPSPVRSARQQLIPPVAVPLKQLAGDAARGWLLDVDSRSVVITRITSINANTLDVVVVETSGKPTRARISMFRDVVAAYRKNNDRNRDPEDQVPVEDAAAVLRLGGHEVVTVQLNLT